MIINMVGGGGGAALNFKVVPGLTQPGTVSENTIWVKTEKIGVWYFSATQPENMQEWDVWFPTGIESVAEFNALKKNALQVYPLSARQIVSGALVDLETKTYQNGVWKDWFEYVIQSGVVRKYGFSTQLRSQTTLPVIVNDGYITVQGNSNMNSGVLTDEKISMEKVSEILLDVDIIQLSANTGAAQPFDGVSLVLAKDAMCISFDAAKSSIEAFINTTKTGRQTLHLPVQNIYSSYYIGIVFGEADGAPIPTVNIYNLSLKP